MAPAYPSHQVMTTHPWKPLVAAYRRPSAARACWQILNSVGVYAAIWFAMALTAGLSWWLTMALAVLAAVMFIRVFIIFHDCGHGSFFGSRAANNAWGFVTGVLTFTPYDHWRGEHAIHHGTTGNLDRRGVGDVWTMTVREYEKSPWWKRWAYRVARNPLILLAIAPLVMFVFEHRVPSARATTRERRSVWLTTLCIVGWGAAMSCALGFLTYLAVQLTILAVAGGVGVWLFYSQHQFEGTYWQRGEDWSYEDAAFRGTAFLKLPRVLQWITGNIGFHHVHHLDSRIPNYNLQACHESHPLFERVAPTTMLRSLRAFGLKLWDEASGKLVRFRRLGRARRGACA